MLGGSVLVETVFSWPGSGYLLNLAIFQRDIPMLQGIILVLAAFFVLAGWVSWRAGRGAVPSDAARPVAKSPAPTGRQRLRWIVCALVPSSLMLSVTAYVSSEIAAVPLLWVLPLALYLGTFVLVFAQRSIIPPSLARRALPIALVPVVMAIATGSTTPISLLVGVHLIALFVVALVCHGEMAAARPPADHLTEFYLWVSFGGVLGGVFNALLAPLLFNGVLEYHLGLIAAAYLGALEVRPARTRRDSKLDVLLPLGLAMLILALIYGLGVDQDPNEREPVRAVIVFGVPALLCFLMSRRACVSVSAWRRFFC
ncbi:MAG: ABC transporter permease subunit [Rhodobacteraceae bacterium]|nr:ABC transporter permease subunit [Paracoccaceae bacterium]